MGFIIAPSIIVAFDNSIDISIIYYLNEEEEKGSETHKNIVVVFSKNNHLELSLLSTNLKNKPGYFSKKYPKPHLNLISPPPEVHIL